jgi:hypothetical protein
LLKGTIFGYSDQNSLKMVHFGVHKPQTDCRLGVCGLITKRQKNPEEAGARATRQEKRAGARKMSA